MLNEVFVASLCPARSYSAAVLGAVFAQWGTLYVSHVRDRDYYVIIGVEGFGVETAALVVDDGLAFVAVSIAYCFEFLADNFTAYVFVVENQFLAGYFLFYFFVLGVKLVLLES